MVARHTFTSYALQAVSYAAFVAVVGYFSTSPRYATMEQRSAQRVVRSTDQTERHRHFHDAQRLFAEELPAIYFAAPRVILATSARLEGATPTVLQPHVLWQPERLRIR